MPDDEQLSADDWLKLYRHLLGRLDEGGLGGVRADIEAAAAAPVFEESTAEDDARVSKIVRGEVGKASIRLRSAPEMFAAAVGVLHSRLVELPAVADAVSRHLGQPLEQIEFRVDSPTQSDPIPLRRLVVNPSEAAQISENFARLGVRVDRIKSR